MWPEPGYVGPPFDQGTGWVTQVNTWSEFSERLEIVFQNFFTDINNQVELFDSFTVDLNSVNNGDVLIITPES